MNRGSTRTRNAALKVAERRRLVVELASLGKTTQKIADEMGVQLHTVENDLRAVRKRIRPESIAGHDATILNRAIEMASAQYLAEPTRNNMAALLAAMERRAKLLGIDAPSRQDVTTGGEPLPAAQPVIYALPERAEGWGCDILRGPLPAEPDAPEEPDAA